MKSEIVLWLARQNDTKITSTKTRKEMKRLKYKEKKKNFL